MSVVLMYHALHRDGDTSEIDQEDLPYALSESAFVSQLDALKDRQVGLLDGRGSPEVVITFDDGHVSNLQIAAPLLQARGLSAYFFVTTDFIDKRPGFMSQTQLCELSRIPGMCIGSHGVSHRFFDDLSAEQSRKELIDSRRQLEQWCGQPCESISFPGGRYSQQTLEQVQSCGYHQWFGSDMGIVSLEQAMNGQSRQSGQSLPKQQRRQPLERVAIRRTTSPQEFARMIEPDRNYFRQHQWRSQAKMLCRRLLGNRLYHGLYKSLSAR